MSEIIVVRGLENIQIDCASSSLIDWEKIDQILTKQEKNISGIRKRFDKTNILFILFYSSSRLLKEALIYGKNIIALNITHAALAATEDEKPSRQTPTPNATVPSTQYIRWG